MTASIYDKIAVELGVAVPESATADFAQWQQWVEDATMLITDRAARLKLSAPDEAHTNYVVRQAVVAHIKKPDDATQVTVSVDDGSSSRTYQSSKGRVTIGDEWWDFLGLVASSGGAFSIDTTPNVARHMPYCSIYFGGSCTCLIDVVGARVSVDGSDP